MINNVEQLTEQQMKIHEEDLQKMAMRVYKEMQKEMAKCNMRINYFSAASLAHLHTILLAVAAHEMEAFAKQPGIAAEIYSYMKNFIIAQEEKSLIKH